MILLRILETPKDDWTADSKMVDLQNEDAFQIPVQELLGDELPLF